MGAAGAGEQKAGFVAPRRINMAVSTATLVAIEHVIAREQVSVTESVRRLLAYGDVIHRAIKDQGTIVVVRRDNGAEHEVILLCP